MHWFFLAAAALAAAVLLWRTQAGGRGGEPAGFPEEADLFLRRLERPEVSGALERAVEALEALMAHPALGGPGFLAVRLSAEEGRVTVTAQYPNIGEALYQRLVQGEPGEDALRAAGVPEALLALGPVFSAESGGVVEIVLAAAALPQQPADRRARQAALEFLEKRLSERFPELSVRRLGPELLLTPAGDALHA